MESLIKTLKQMPDVFTSNQFNNAAVKNGYPRKMLSRKGLASFIRLHCENKSWGSKTWTKIKSTNNSLKVTGNDLLIDKIPHNSNIEKAI